MVAHRRGPAVEHEAVVRGIDRDRAVLARRMRDVEERREIDLRQAAQREAPPLLLLPGRQLGRLEALQRREPILEQPARLAPSDTEPLDRFAVERQRRRSDGSEAQPMAPCICSWIRRFISIA
jgi:hypothetical protein